MTNSAWDQTDAFNNKGMNEHMKKPPLQHSSKPREYPSYMLLFLSKYEVIESSLASKERSRFMMSTGLHMTYDLLLCCLRTSAGSKKEWKILKILN